MFERDLTDLREKLANATRSINAATGDMQVQDVTIRTLRGKYLIFKISDYDDSFLAVKSQHLIYKFSR